MPDPPPYNDNTQQPPPPSSGRRPSSALSGMLRKTKNIIRGPSNNARNITDDVIPDETEHEDDPINSAANGGKIDGSSRLSASSSTPERGKNHARMMSSNSFFASSSWDAHNGLSRSINGAVNINLVANRTTPSNIAHGQYNNADDVLTVVESSLRTLVIYTLIYTAGTQTADLEVLVGGVQKVLELACVAWGTCLIITALIWLQKRRILHEVERADTTTDGVAGAAALNTQQRSADFLNGEQTQELVHTTNSSNTSHHDGSTLDVELSYDSNNHYNLNSPTITTTTNQTRAITRTISQSLSSSSSFMPPNLQQLEHLYIMLIGKDRQQGKHTRLSPNGIPVKIDTELFSGEMLLMFRTSQVDDDDQHPSNKNIDPTINYFKGKQRRFEWQWQIKLKKIPTGDVYVGCELDEPPQMGMIQRALVNAALKFVKKMNPGFGYYFSSENTSSVDGKTPSYLSFPVGSSMDRFVASKPGEEVPTLGKEIYEDSDMLKRRKRGEKGAVVWNTEDTYTMALWSAYIDWLDWQVLNFPGIRPFSVTSVAGVQPIKVNLYTIRSSNSDGGQEEGVGSANPPRNVMMELEVSNSAKASLGTEAKAWRANRASSTLSTTSTTRVLKYDEGISLCESDEEDNAVEDVGNETPDSDPALEQSDYVLSGMHLSLRESTGGFLASGRSYALLQSSPTSVIVLEKLFESKKAQKSVSSDPQLVIKNGDIVRVKLINLSSNATKYLRTHGWWLRWTSNRPTKTSSFYISINDPDAPALLLGTGFSLRSKRWNNYHVGVCYESSAKFGGRMLAMFKAGTTTEEEPAMDCDEEDEVMEDLYDKDFEMPVKRTTMPLLLHAEISDTSFDVVETLSPTKRGSSVESQHEKFHSQVESMPSDLTVSHYHLDCPVWLEVMNRATRLTQLVYAVRVKETISGESSETTVKLRSGKEIASLMKLGVLHQNDIVTSEDAWQISNMQVNEDSGIGLQRNNSFSSSSDESDDEVMEDEPIDFLIEGPENDDLTRDLDSNMYPEEEDSDVNAPAINTFDSSAGHVSDPKDEEVKSTLESSSKPVNHTTIEIKKKSKTKVLNRVAKTVKSSTVITGKQVIKQSKKVGKATVNTGLAAGRVIPNAYKPPKKHEPGGRFSSKKAPKNKSMKYVGRAIKNTEGCFSTETHSGQLTAPDLSREKISQILQQLTMNKSLAITDALSAFVKVNSEQDLAFLRGCSAELGVIPLKTVDTESDYDCICARGIWEGRWREECCVIYGNDNHLALYAPLSRKPNLVVSFDEILAVRKCHPRLDLDPLPGLPILSIDTAWRCHYLAFATESDRECFLEKINDAMYHANSSDVTKQTRKIAQEWESYKMSLETSLTGSGGKWTSVMIGKKSKQKRKRMIFNSRKMAFDLESVVDHGKIGNDGGSKTSKISLFIEDLLHMALTLSPETMGSTEMRFLDEVSRLRSLPLQEIEYESREALCIFVNLYHCLLQHALLFAVDGLPDKRSATRFKRCSCYEIGGDVFSLAELECCVIRGKLSKAVHIKSPLVDAGKKSRPYLQYALDAADNRVNFYLNTGSMDYPSHVPVLQCETLEHQIQAASSSFLKNQIEINVKKRVVTIPKVCDVYRNDFGMGDCLVCLSQILRYLDESSQLLIASLLENGGQITVRFKTPSECFHANLCKRNSEDKNSTEL